MFAIGLMLAATFLEEISNSLGKRAVARRIESIYVLGFLSLFWGSIAMIAMVVFFGFDFHFSKASLPYFIPRMVSEIVIATVSVKAIAVADRSTYAFLRLITIPLLLAVDIVVGYSVKPLQILGALVVFGAIVALLATHSMSRKGAAYVLFAAIFAVIPISLYKYDITHFNSVIGEQLILYLILISYFTFMGWYTRRENTWRYLLRAMPEGQSLVMGVGSVISSFAYGLAPASVVVAAQRGTSLLWAILFGNIYFHEKHLYMKFVAYGLVITGLAVMIF